MHKSTEFLHKDVVHREGDIEWQKKIMSISILKNILPKNYASPDLDKRILSDVVYLFTNTVHLKKSKATV